MNDELYNTKIFTEVFDEATDFVTEFKASPFYNSPLGTLEDNSIVISYYLLYNKYGNNPIANMDENQFKFKLFGILAQFGPTWQLKLKIQEKLRSLGLDSNSEIYKGSRAIYNHAFNPETTPSTADLNELNYINEQNTTGYKKSVLEGLALLMESLKNDVTDDFINKFRKLFKIIVYPEKVLLYESEE